MNFLAIDYGERRIGLAHGDSEIGIAMPVPAAVEKTPEERLAHIGNEIRSRRIGTLVVGYPVNMDGSCGYKTREVDAFIAVLEARFGLPSCAWTRRFRATRRRADCPPNARAGATRGPAGSIAARAKSIPAPPPSFFRTTSTRICASERRVRIRAAAARPDFFRLRKRERRRILSRNIFSS